MKLLNIAAGPIVGKAYEHLLELRLEHGPLGKERAEQELMNWWSARSQN
jgi:poly(A) polymerase